MTRGPTRHRSATAGAFAEPDGGEWRAYRGVVESRSDAGREVRLDRERVFERLLVGNAPRGLLPRDLRTED